MKRLLGFLVLASIFPVEAIAGKLVVVEKGEPRCKIIISPNATAVERYAARELQAALAKATGAKPEISEAPSGSGTQIILATPAQRPELAAKFGNSGTHDAISVFTKEDTLYLAGKNPRSVLYATYRFLEESLGFRWLWPGDEGEFFQKSDQLVVDGLEIQESAAVEKRALAINSPHYDKDTLIWMARNRFNYHPSNLVFKAPQHEDLHEKGFVNYLGGHNLILPRAVLEANPDFVAQYGGIRKLTAHSPHLCWSNSGVQQALIDTVARWVEARPLVNVWTLLPTDHGRFCQCDACVEMAPDVSTRFQKLSKIIIEGVRKIHPHAKFNALAYQAYRALPSEVAPFDTVAYTAYNVSYRHSLKSDSPTNTAPRKELKEWIATGVPIGYRGYDMIPFKDRLFVPLVSYQVDQIGYLREAGISMFSTEVTPFNHPKNIPAAERNWDSNRMNLYAIGRALWDASVTAEKIVEDWTTAVYGKEAGAVMARYYFAVEKAWTQAPNDISYFLHPGALYARGFITPELIKQADGAFSEARKILAQQPTPSQRALAQVDFEEKLFGRWKELSKALDSNTEHYIRTALKTDAELPALLDPQNDAWKGAPMLPPFRTSTGDAKDATEVSMLWKGDTLYLKVLCKEQPGDERVARFANRDEDIWADDCIEIFLNHPDGIGYYHLAVNSLGGRYDAESKGGMNLDKDVNPAWSASVTADKAQWSAIIALPLSEFGYTNKKEVALSIVRTRVGKKEKSGWPSNAYHSPGNHGTIQLRNELPATLVIYNNSKRSSDALTSRFRKEGWQVRVTSDEIDLPKNAFFLLAYNTGKDFTLSSAYMQTVVRPWLESGGKMLVAGIGPIPFDKWFQENDLKVQWSGWKASPYRVSASVADGEWKLKPNNLATTLEKRLTPPSGFTSSGDRWETLATITLNDGSPAAYLLRTRIGKGTLYLTSSSMGFSGGSEMFGSLRPDNVFKLIENLHTTP